MKKLMLFLWILLAPFFCFSQLKRVTFQDLESLQKTSPKPVIIHLYTEWCLVCKIESFELNKDKNLIRFIDENFYFVDFEAEKTKEKILFQKKEFSYLPNGNSGIHELALALSKNKNQPVYPLWIILDENQNLVGYHEGLLKASEMRERLNEVLRP